jgi:hypothetical protein
MKEDSGFVEVEMFNRKSKLSEEWKLMKWSEETEWFRNASK